MTRLVRRCDRGRARTGTALLGPGRQIAVIGAHQWLAFLALRRLLLVRTILGVSALLEALDALFKRVTPRLLLWGRSRPAASR